LRPQDPSIQVIDMSASATELAKVAGSIKQAFVERQLHSKARASPPPELSSAPTR